jgi:leukemia factor-related protein
MEYHPLPPVSTMINPPQVPSAHIPQLITAVNNGNNVGNQILLMQSSMSNDIHTLHTNQNNLENSSDTNNNHTVQHLASVANVNVQNSSENNRNIQNVASTNNLNPSDNHNEETNRWTQYQMQQLWRHHNYINGNVDAILSIVCLVAGHLIVG